MAAMSSRARTLALCDVFIHGQSLRLEPDGAAVAGLELSEIAGTVNAASAAAIEIDLSRFDTDCLPTLFGSVHIAPAILSSCHVPA
jgi:hypothetical protein